MSPARMARLEAALHLVMDFNSAFNRRDVAGMMNCLSEDCLFEDSTPPPDGNSIRGREAISGFFQDFFNETREARIEIEDIYSLGLRCIMRWKYEWLAQDGTRGHLRGADLFTLKDGRINEILSYAKG